MANQTSPPEGKKKLDRRIQSPFSEDAPLDRAITDHMATMRDVGYRRNWLRRALHEGLRKLVADGDPDYTALRPHLCADSPSKEPAR